jgi:hypothetical protein
MLSISSEKKKKKRRNQKERIIIEKNLIISHSDHSVYQTMRMKIKLLPIIKMVFFMSKLIKKKGKKQNIAKTIAIK